MGYILNKKNEELGEELNEILSSLGYEIEIKPDDETEEKEKKNDEEDA